MPVSIFTKTQTRARTFPFSRLLEVLLVFVIPRSFTVFGEWARLLVLPYGTCRAYNERMESFVSAESSYLTVPLSSRASADLLSRSSHGRSGCAVSSLRNPENGTQSTRLFFHFHTTISQGE